MFGIGINVAKLIKLIRAENGPVFNGRLLVLKRN